MALVKHLFGSYAEYQSYIQANPTSDAVIFVFDNQGNRRLYRGTELIASHNVDFVTAVPNASEAFEGRLYVVQTADEVGLYIKNNGLMEQVGGALKSESITTLEVFKSELVSTVITADSTDGQLATAKAVHTALDAAKTELSAAIEELGGSFAGVTAARSEDNTGTVLQFTDKDGNKAAEVTVADLFLSGTNYDPSTHILTLTVQGGGTFDVDLNDLVPQAVATSNVAMSRNIVATVAVGNIAKGQTIDISKVTDLQTFLETMLSQDSLPTAAAPSVTLTTPNNTAYEVGTSVVPTAYAVFSVGSYSQTAAKNQVSSGVVLADDNNGVAWTLTCTGQTSKTYPASTGNNLGSSSAPIAFDAITVEDNTSVAVTVTAKHSKGNDPLSYLGNTEVGGVLCSTKTIAAGTKKDDNNTKITGYRKCFYGTLNAKDGTINSELVRGLANSTTSAVAAGSKLTIDVPAGCTRIVLAYPASVRDVNSITSAEEFGSEIKDSFTPHTIDVEGASAGYATSYKVYVKDLANAQGTATTFSVTI